MKGVTFVRCILQESYTILGVLGGFLAIVCLVDFNEIFPSIIVRGLIVCGIFLFSFVIACIKVLVTRTASIDLLNGREAEIKFGDILNETDNIVIPVNRYFDTLVDNRVISAKSIHGQFIKQKFAGNVGELDRLIDEDLNTRGIQVVKNVNKTGKQKQYPLGTVVNIEKEGKRYFLLALTDCNQDNVAFCEIGDYYSNVIKLMNHINNFSQGASVAIPLLGGGLTRMKRQNDILLDNLISIMRMSDIPITNKIKIVLSKADLGKINMHKFKNM